MFRLEKRVRIKLCSNPRLKISRKSKFKINELLNKELKANINMKMTPLL